MAFDPGKTVANGGSEKIHETSLEAGWIFANFLKKNLR
jgi:hypothetical protein